MRGFEGGQMPLHRRLPKRGFTDIFRVEYTVFGLDRVAEILGDDSGDASSRWTSSFRSACCARRAALIKVLNNGEIAGRRHSACAQVFEDGARRPLKRPAVRQC